MGFGDYLSSIILGIVQGVTEFFPISSSGHLIVGRALLPVHVTDTLAFDVALHWGTLVAVIIVLRKDLARLLGAWWRSIRQRSMADTDARLAWWIALGTAPAAIAGLLFADWLDTYARTTSVVVVTLISVGLVFFLVERIARPTRSMAELTWGIVLLIGIAQAIALVPGVSRSGITIVAAILLGVQRSEAARFSFILSVPIIALAGLSQILDLANMTLETHDIVVFVLGFIASAISGTFAVRFLLRFLKTRSLRIFGWYRIGLAILLLMFLR